MTAQGESLWTIDELGARVALALAVNYEGQTSGSVRDVPDRRTIRYYTTLGLIDRPTSVRGRTALYGRRHLLQLVAIKRLQARGLSLAELQRDLFGMTARQLERVAELPGDVEAKGQTTAEPEPRRAFWKDLPAEPEVSAPAAAQGDPAAPLSLQGVSLTEDATLLINTARPLYPDDVEAMRVAAGPLLKLLEKRRLLKPRPERRTP